MAFVLQPDEQHVWLIEHPKGMILIDTGERAAVTDVEDYLRCDPSLAWFVRRNFHLRVHPDEEVTA